MNDSTAIVERPDTAPAVTEAPGSLPPDRDRSGRKMENLVGQKFGRLAVIGYYGLVDGQSRWFCQCDCGALATAITVHLKRGAVRSCGCLKKESVKAKRASGPRSHGGTHTPEYRIWNEMRQRCGNPNNQNYKYYGARGIKVCAEWQSFENFIRDMGRRPSPDLSIERIDNDGDYCAGNCCWATRSEQTRNRRRPSKRT